LEILDSDKTKYAKVVADRLCKLEPEALPSKIIALFEQIKRGIKT
jgi:putative ATP-dependent endonuclease of OLD family